MEWSASLRIAIEPVIAAAASFSAIRSALEAIETPAAAGLVMVNRVCVIAPPPGSSASSRAARPRWLIACFSRGRQLGHGALVAGPGVVGDEGGVVAEAAAAARRIDQRPLAAALEQLLLPVLADQRDHADVGEALVPASRSSASSFCRFCSSLAPSPAKRAERTPGRPPSAAASIPESSAIAARPVASCAARALPSALAAKVSPSSGGSSTSLGQRLQLEAGQRLAQLAQLVLVAGRDDHRSHAPGPRLAGQPADGLGLRVPQARDPALGEASSSSRCARESGVRSAVACTSTSPPSPVMTTLASTSAFESSP